MRLALKLFRGEPAISELDWNFSAIHKSSPHFSTCVWFGPPRCLTTASTCSWIGRPVSGLQQATYRPIKTRFPCGSGAERLNLAAYHNSLARSTKSTMLHFLIVLHLFVSIGFQVLFHSPPGVLFTFPSRYCYSIGHQVVFSLGGWAPLLPTGLHVSGGTLVPAARLCFSPTGLLPSLVRLSIRLLLNYRDRVMPALNPIRPKTIGLGSSHFARRYFENRCFFLFLRLLRCFSSPGSLRIPIDSEYGDGALPPPGFPIRTSADQCLLATPRSFSQLATSFIGS